MRAVLYAAALRELAAAPRPPRPFDVVRRPDGKAEIEWANAALIARMREREPVIAAECVRLAAEVARLTAALEYATSPPPAQEPPP